MSQSTRSSIPIKGKIVAKYPPNTYLIILGKGISTGLEPVNRDTKYYTRKVIL